jgi:hypothetical protein
MSHRRLSESPVAAIPQRRCGARRAGAWSLAAMLSLLGATGAGGADGALQGDPVEQGRRIYQEGVLVSGAPLTGTRASGVPVSGQSAVCIGCHRRSGMGTVEGDIQLLPVTRPYLFPQAGDEPVAVMDLRYRHAMNVRHAPYTGETLARALREGINSDDQPLHDLMPRYELADADLVALTAYLKQLSSQASPGVTETRLHLASVIAPGVDPVRSKALTDTLRNAVIGKNGSVMSGGRHMVSAAEIRLKTERFWDLDVWELEGPPESWRTQLQERYRVQPVFALVSGISEGTWQPVQDFCNAEHVPCWFPSVDLPPAKEEFYSLYFSRGVLLEADVLGRHLGGLKKGKPRRVVQVIRDDEVGHGAADQLHSALAGSGIAVEDLVLKNGDAAQLRGAFKGIGRNDAVMFWLRRADIAALGRVPLPGAGGGIYFSGRLSGAEHAPFPQSWKARVRLVYPYMLPDGRDLSLSAFRGWLQLHKLALVDEPLQAEAFFATVAFSETQSEMLNNFYRDYLVERAEEELGRREAGKAEQLSRDVAYSKTAAGGRERERIAADRAAMKKDAMVVIRRESTTIYPRLGLDQTQRYASKGAYIVRFTGKDDAIVAETGWIVP